MCHTRLLESVIFCVHVVFVTFIVGVVSAPSDCVDTGQCVFEKHSCDSKFKAEIERLRPLFGKTYKYEETQVDNTVVTYNAGICIPVENTGSQAKTNLTTAGVTQDTKHSTGAPIPHVIGSIEAAELKAGKDWIELEYENGDTYGSHCGYENRRAVIMITCLPGEHKGVFVLTNEYNEKTGDCMYLFELSHDAACDVHSSGGLSIGSIICIVFFVVVVLYLLIGFLYQRFVVGAKGMEQLPHLAFWQDFGNLQADGCDLIFRRGTKTSGSRQYRGIGDDQLTPSADPDPDDHLLPM